MKRHHMAGFVPRKRRVTTTADTAHRIPDLLVETSAPPEACALGAIVAPDPHRSMPTRICAGMYPTRDAVARRHARGIRMRGAPPALGAEPLYAGMPRSVRSRGEPPADESFRAPSSYT